MRCRKIYHRVKSARIRQPCPREKMRWRRGYIFGVMLVHGVKIHGVNSMAGPNVGKYDGGR